VSSLAQLDFLNNTPLLLCAKSILQSWFFFEFSPTIIVVPIVASSKNGQRLLIELRLKSCKRILIFSVVTGPMSNVWETNEEKCR